MSTLLPAKTARLASLGCFRSRLVSILHPPKRHRAAAETTGPPNRGLASAGLAVGSESAGRVRREKSLFGGRALKRIHRPGAAGPAAGARLAPHGAGTRMPAAAIQGRKTEFRPHLRACGPGPVSWAGGVPACKTFWKLARVRRLEYRARWRIEPALHAPISRACP